MNRLQRSQVAGRVFFLCVLCASVVILEGCAGNGSRMESATGGVELSLYVRDASGAEMLYDVKRDGTLSFGGGMDARLGNTTWTGMMTEEEIRQLHELLSQREWFKAKLRSTDEPEGVLYRVSINAPQSRRRFTLKGEHESVKPVRELLEKVALRRLEGDLERLPKPSLERRP